MESLNHFYHCNNIFYVKAMVFYKQGDTLQLSWIWRSTKATVSQNQTYIPSIKTSQCSKYKRRHRQIHIYNGQCQKKITTCCPFSIPIKAHIMITNWLTLPSIFIDISGDLNSYLPCTKPSNTRFNYCHKRSFLYSSTQSNSAWPRLLFKIAFLPTVFFTLGKVSS